jgi:predicted outer membrane protein
VDDCACGRPGGTSCPAGRSRVANPRTKSKSPGRTENLEPAGYDQTIAQCLAIKNQEEVGLAKLAAQHSQNPQVKQFADKLIKAHSQMLEQLRKFGGAEIALHSAAGAGRDQATAAREPGRRPGATESQRTAAREAGGVNFIDIERQIAEKCLQNAEKEWSKQQGAEADKHFLGAQIIGHQQMINSLEVLQQHAGPELQAVIEKGISSTQQHLSEAEQLMKQLAHAGGQNPARSGADQSRSSN